MWGKIPWTPAGSAFVCSCDEWSIGSSSERWTRTKWIISVLDLTREYVLIDLLVLTVQTPRVTTDAVSGRVDRIYHLLNSGLKKTISSSWVGIPGVFIFPLQKLAVGNLSVRWMSRIFLSVRIAVVCQNKSTRIVVNVVLDACDRVRWLCDTSVLDFSWPTTRTPPPTHPPLSKL